jgi:hypothetical protein
MLQIGVHDRNERCGSSKNAFDACGRKSTSAYPLEAANAIIRLSDPSNQAMRAVDGIVVDKEQLPAGGTKDRLDPPKKFADIVRFVVRGYDD